MVNIIEWHNNNFYNDRHINFRLKDIFSDSCDNFVKSNPNLRIRPVVFKEINRMISCRTSSLCYSLYECPDCGNKYTKKRAENILQKCYNCKHRHIVFTISNYLWDLFKIDRKRLNLLFEAASKTLLSWFKDKYKSEFYTPGIIAVLTHLW